MRSDTASRRRDIYRDAVAVIAAEYAQDLTVESVARHQRYRRIFFLQVLIDDGRFVDHSRAVDQDRNFPVRVKL